MKNLFRYFILLLSVLAICQNADSQAFPFDEENWTIESRGAVIDAYEGEENTLFLQAGRATLRDVSFLNGIIEFDIYLAKRRGFPGILFRMQDNINYEEFYLRPHQSGNPDAMQYTPVFNGLSAWQLYHDQGAGVQDGRVTWRMVGSEGYNTIYTYPFDRWLHVKLVVSNTQMDVYFGHEETPTLQVRELKQKAVSGPISLRAATCPIYFANFSVTKMDSPPLHPIPPATAVSMKDLIQQWHISNPFKEQSLESRYHLDEAFLKNKSWQLLECEPSGLGNISKVTAPKDRSENMVLAKITLTSSEQQTKRLDFGYSDRVKVYCNGQLLYSGNNGFRTRDYRYLGTIGFFDSVYLPLKSGRNEIIFAVAENFGGWGIQAKLEDLQNISSVE